jgi:diaminopimelate decarboxylase/aspartate kinase
VAASELPEFIALAKSAKAHIVGLHAHSGSGIRTPDAWPAVARKLAALVGDLPEVRYLDVGGGLGVPEKRGQRVLDLDAVGEALAEVLRYRPELELWIEPGRYLVATAGVILTRVTQRKSKGDVRFVGVDVGMNTLIRPALYGAYHEIVNLTRLGASPAEVVNIVGPICESGDTLGHERPLPRSEEGDVLLIANAGAYGRVMSSDYNLRPPAAERVLA